MKYIALLVAIFFLGLFSLSLDVHGDAVFDEDGNYIGTGYVCDNVNVAFACVVGNDDICPAECMQTDTQVGGFQPSSDPIFDEDGNYIGTGDVCDNVNVIYACVINNEELCPAECADNTEEVDESRRSGPTFDEDGNYIGTGYICDNIEVIFDCTVGNADQCPIECMDDNVDNVDDEDDFDDEETFISSIPRIHNGLIAVNLQDAVDYLHTNGLTIFGTVETFMGDQNLRRDEASAFFARFARDVLEMEPDVAQACVFDDLGVAHQDLLGEVKASCQLGLFKGNQGKFMPVDTFSNAHALTVLIRLLEGPMQEPTNNWAINYYHKARELGLTAGLAADGQANLYAPIKRGDMALMIEAASQSYYLSR